jgi:hypothetical protein
MGLQIGDNSKGSICFGYCRFERPWPFSRNVLFKSMARTPDLCSNQTRKTVVGDFRRD